MSYLRSLATFFSAAILSGVALCDAATVVEEFTSYDVDSVVGLPWQAETMSQDNGAHRLTRVRQDSDNLFGKGAGNKYLDLFYRRPTSSEDTAGILLYTVVPGSYGMSGQVDLKFYDPDVSTGSRNSAGVLIRLSTNSGRPANISSPFALHLYKGQVYKTLSEGIAWDRENPVGTYSLKAVNDLTIVFNNANSPVSYDGGKRSVASGTFDLWLNGQLIASGIGKSNTAPAGARINSIALNTSISGATQMFIDSVNLSDTITIGSGGNR